MAPEGALPDEHSSDARRISDEIRDLLPYGCEDETMARLEQIRKIALPSVIESVGGGGLIRGVPEGPLRDRSALLAWQYRMHPDIAAFSHQHVYGRRALHTPDTVESSRKWSYDAYRRRLVWIDMKGDDARYGRSYSNRAEAERIMAEIKSFAKYASQAKSPTGDPWSVAVLSFYAGQRSLIRDMLRGYTGQTSSYSFAVPKRDPAIEIGLYTVDSFQGHEADVVFLSLVRQRPTLFLNQINRLNVAVTRARFQCVIVANRQAMLRADPPLRILAEEVPSQYVMEGGGNA